MGTIAYVKAATSVTEYPLVTFARSIGKNTAELDGRDLKKFLRWLWKTEPYKNKKWQPKESTKYFKGNIHVREREHGIGKLMGGGLISAMAMGSTKKRMTSLRGRDGSGKESTTRTRT